VKIIIDSYIPYIKGAFDNVADVEYLPYKEITPDTIRDADALVVRTRTHCDEQLLQNSNVKFIASATIGYDHIDAAYCAQKGIAWTNAPGCNALSVAQYIASVLSFLCRKNNYELTGKTMGIVGVGAVGTKIATLARSFGMNVLLNDPPRARKEVNETFVPLDIICKQADIISFHTLLNVSGVDKSFHLADKAFFDRLERKPVIINAARGEIVDTSALIHAVKQEKVSDIVLDCWENEPDIDRELLTLTTLATPHIAGYSAEGKANAATQSVQAISRFFGLGLDNWETNKLIFPNKDIINDITTALPFFEAIYNVEADNALLKNTPEEFEQQRSNYFFHHEPKAYFEIMNKDFAVRFAKQFDVFFYK